MSTQSFQKLRLWPSVLQYCDGKEGILAATVISNARTGRTKVSHVVWVVRKLINTVFLGAAVTTLKPNAKIQKSTFKNAEDAVN